MRVCILCEDSKIAQLRREEKKEVLPIPLSESGELPATHWFCCIATTQEKAEELVKTAKLSIMEIAEPKAFLEKWNLKIIK